MHFRFDAQQEFQITAVEAVAGLFEGQPRTDPDLMLAFGGLAVAAIANRVDLTDAQLLENLHTVQGQNQLAPDDTLHCLEEAIETGEGPKIARFPNFSVEMETGTGKTYVYIRTALELYRRYGFRKYIIVVPSVAVREGVLKMLAITKKHFQELYGNLSCRSYIYDSANLSQVRQFALSDSVELMVMTIDSFNRAANVIRQSTDRLQGETPIHLIQATRPILILDEPQNMESELRIKALAALDPLLALRYSATHKNPYNLVYRLTPYDAYRQGLVKRIEIAGITKDEDANRAFLRLDEIKTQKNTVTAKIAVHQLLRTGAIKEKVVTVKPGDSLRDKADRPEYDGFEIDEINPGGGFVRFANNVELSVGDARGADKDAVFASQIRYTIEEHFRKQAKLKDRGIKVLSLFFIDRVDNYAQEDGIIRRLFNQAFDDLKQQHPEWRDRDSETVQAAYFAERRRRDGVDLIDSSSGVAEADIAAYDLIMKAKERLLSFDEPVSFIFSHSALREGWDNPNVFQICTLNQSRSEMKKRQEIGRGVRLSVDQHGGRVHDGQVNVLTVVANQSYERYVAGLQSEIEEDFGASGLPPKPANARLRGRAVLRKEYTLKPEFQELWERIKQRTRYLVNVETEALLDQVVPLIDALTVRPPQVSVTKGVVVVDDDDRLGVVQLTPKKTAGGGEPAPLPNLVDLMMHLMEYTTPPVRLTRRTLLEIYRRTSNKDAALANPHEFATQAVRVIKEKLADHLVEGIEYQRINEWYEMAQFQGEVGGWLDKMVPTVRSPYDHVVFESDPERRFVEDLERLDYVRMYLKLPDWFTVPTPIGEYNPDWAIVMEDRDDHGDSVGRPLLYLVRETKSTTLLSKLWSDERRKISCGQHHFNQTLGVDYRVVTNAAELP
ncbi:MAG: DEAD/DEAH box helicase family protein [Chloroflexota bacterium]|nr:DEAD/DEAH box helicase family protein [Chloroflexota bacterium]